MKNTGSVSQRAHVIGLWRSAEDRCRLGDYETAASLFETALSEPDLERVLSGLELAGLLNGCGVAYKYSGRFEEAESVYQRALTLIEQSVGPDHPDAATLYHNLGGLE